MAVQYWLMKTEPTTFSIEGLANSPRQTTCWEGVRNYQARNLLRDTVQLGDRVLVYHSSCAQPAVVGTAQVVRAGYPDPSAADPRSHYHDAKHDPNQPRWYAVDLKLETTFQQSVTLAVMRQAKPLAEMGLLRRGNRLSVQSVTAHEFEYVLKLAGQAS